MPTPLPAPGAAPAAVSHAHAVRHDPPQRPVDLARVCADLARQIDPGDQMRISYGEARILADAPGLIVALASALRYLAGVPCAWVTVEVQPRGLDWVTITLSGRCRRGGGMPAPLCPALAPQHPVPRLGLADLAAPAGGFLTMPRGDSVCALRLHMPGRILHGGDPALEARRQPGGVYDAAV